MSATDQDEGFIVIDALAGATILALAGTVVVLIASAAISRAADDLDRSVALLTLEGMAAEVRLVGAAATSFTFPHEQGGLQFQITENGGTNAYTLSVSRNGQDNAILVALDVAGPMPRDVFP